jgi:hypothetical protein
MRILLGGGGAEDERPLNEVLAGWVGGQGGLLYWPIALRGIRTFDSCFAWITSSLNPLGLTDLASHRESEMEAFSAVYIGRRQYILAAGQRNRQVPGRLCQTG